MRIGRGDGLALAWVAAGAAIYGGGLYSAAGAGGKLGDVPEALPACDATCVAAWAADLSPGARTTYLRFQVADAAHALLGASLLALASLRLAKRQGLARPIAVLAPTLLAAAELIENAALGALASGSVHPLLAASAVGLRTGKFAALATSLVIVAWLALAAALRRLRRTPPGAA